LQNPGLPHTAVQKINRSSRDSGAARQSVFFAKLSFLRKKHSRGGYSTEFFAKLFSKASIKHAQRGVRDDPLSLPSFLSRERKRARDYPQGATAG